MKVVEIPSANVRDIPRGLRNLADRIEAGEYGAVNFLAWALDAGGQVETGGLGPSPEPVAAAYLIFAIAQRKLEGL